MRHAFDRFARACAEAVGSVGAFILSVAVVALWAALGPPLHFSGAWQLTINTGTTIVTFWMVFILQNTQTNDTRALHTKLDEVILALRRADNRAARIEQAEEQDLEHLRARQLAAKKEDQD